MVSKEVTDFYKSNKIDKLYKTFEKSFNLVDSWAETMINGDLMDENDIHFAMQQLSGVYAKLNPVAGCLDSLVIEYENNYILQEEKGFEKIRIQDKDHCKAVGRSQVSDLRSYASDFSRYCYSANTMIVTCQSRLKRLVVSKGNQGIGFSGETIKAEQAQTKKWDE